LLARKDGVALADEGLLADLKEGKGVSRSGWEAERGGRRRMERRAGRR
jgi:hypothetical protein